MKNDLKNKIIFSLLSTTFLLLCVCIVLGTLLYRHSNEIMLNVEITAMADIYETNISDITAHTDSIAEKININTASKEELIMLDGIGDVLAERIIEYREENGSFSSIEEIQNVKGIGTLRFNTIKDYITV